MKEFIKRLFRLDLDAYIILALLFFVIFLIPLFPERLERTLYDISLLFIFFWAILNTPRYRAGVLAMVLMAVVARWLISPFFEVGIFEKMASGINTLVFLFVVSQLIFDIARVREIKTTVILDAINGYLLLGLAFTNLIAYLHFVDPEAFNIDSNPNDSLADYTYFGFVTLSTLGYGDIVPQTPPARSLAILISVSGQMYVAIIIALLVGKIASGENGPGRD
jgi:hypothetical protein